MPPVIDQAEVRRIARLARLKLSEQEVRLFTGQLARILEYVKQIESLCVKTSPGKVSPAARRWRTRPLSSATAFACRR
jgi:aspartyl/glutamyl-tRNA(Asn/Gln) amidotransferase C subunit